MLELELLSNGPERTLALGEMIGRAAQGGWRLALAGPLGAGKTHFVKGLALGLGIAPDGVQSPTFVLLRRHEGRLRLYHLDAYRLPLDARAALWDIGLEECLADGRGIVALEWADRAGGILGTSTLSLDFEHIDERRRRIRLCGDAQHEPLLDELARVFA